MLKPFLLTSGILIIVIAVYFPSRHARHYDYIPLDKTYDHLVLKDFQNTRSNLKICTYKHIISQNNDIEISSVTANRSFIKPLTGGEYSPTNCQALIKTAVIVPYRRRNHHLQIFLNYMHPFLQSHNLHYRIFIVDQNDTLPFNRAKMLNYGAKLAMKLKYDCLILHDVDLIPLNSGNIYGCAKKPRHMSSSLDTFRYNLPYLTLLGGAVAILADQFQAINGMSNKFYGWGAEDDDFYRRLISGGFEPCRFSPEISRYTMLQHMKETASPERLHILEDTMGKEYMDGLNTLSHKYIIELKNLYTHILAS